MSDEQTITSEPLSLEKIRAEGRDARGRFERGNSASLKHGLRSRGLPDNPELAALHQEKCEEITRDLGGDVARLKADAVREAARLAILVDSLGNDLLARGVFTPTGKCRAALNAYCAIFDRYIKACGSLGIERVAKKAPSVEAYMQGRFEP